MKRMNLMFNGAEHFRVENGKYYIVDEETEYDFMRECTRSEFIKELKAMSWVCLTTWDKKLRQQYLDLVDYVKEMK